MHLPSTPLAVIGICLLAAGCGTGGEPTHPVTGRVTFSDGAPVPDARVSFTSQEQGISAFGKTDASGQYSLKVDQEGAGEGVPAGKYQAVVVHSPPQPEVQEGPATAPVRKPPSPIHPKYSRYESSGLEFQVSEGANTIDIKVDRNPAAR